VLHVRVVSPQDLTPRLLSVLSAEAGVRNLVVLPGAARLPDGDAVQFDLLNESANPVLRQLRGLHEDSRGSVTVGEVNVAMAGPRNATETRRYARREQIPVWAMVEGTIRSNATYPPSFYILLVIAGVIAAVGILTNSQILVIGAMVVGPEYFAIIAAALGCSKRDWPLVHESLTALGRGFVAAVIAAFLFALAIRAAGLAPAAFLNGVRPVAELINSPNIFSVVVAVLAGIAGVVSLTESRANALIGVFISITTLPAAASIGLSVAFGSWHDALGSLYQLLLNVGILIVVGAAGLSAQRGLWHRLAGPDEGATGWRWD
jgi:uncharacterized hydrophobic protein (TIGR00271 family)